MYYIKSTLIQMEKLPTTKRAAFAIKVFEEMLEEK